MEINLSHPLEWDFCQDILHDQQKKCIKVLENSFAAELSVGLISGFFMSIPICHSDGNLFTFDII